MEIGNMESTCTRAYCDDQKERENVRCVKLRMFAYWLCTTLTGIASTTRRKILHGFVTIVIFWFIGTEWGKIRVCDITSDMAAMV